MQVLGLQPLQWSELPALTREMRDSMLNDNTILGLMIAMIAKGKGKGGGNEIIVYLAQVAEACRRVTKAL